MDHFATSSLAHLPIDTAQPPIISTTDEDDIISDDDAGKSVDIDWQEADSGDPENQLLSSLPSAFPLEVRWGDLKLCRLARKEANLREGQANDALQKVHEVVSHLSWQFKGKVRNSKTTKQTTRAWDGVNVLNRELRTQRRIYNHARNILISLSDNKASVTLQYKILSKEDCHISTVISTPNAAGQSQKGLAWFWTQAGGNLTADNTDEHMMECECRNSRRSIIINFSSLPSSLAAC